MDIKKLKDYANKFQKNRDELAKINKAISQTYRIDLYFTECKDAISNLEILQNNARNERLTFPEEEYEVAKEYFEKGEYQTATDIVNREKQKLRFLLQRVEEALNLVQIPV